jgi:hypothetical protein
LEDEPVTRRRGPRQTIDWSVPQSCLECMKPMVKANKVRRPPEGFVMHTAKGLCGTCTSRIRKGYKARVIPIYDPIKGLECRSCKETLPLDKFEHHSKNSTTLKLDCRLCNVLVYSYKITKQRYLEILENQDFRCAICKDHVDALDRNLCVDHDHSCCPNGRRVVVNVCEGFYAVDVTKA